MKRVLLSLALGVLFNLTASGANPRIPEDLAQHTGVLSPQVLRVNADYGKIPLQFIPNRGQVDGPAAFYVKGRDKTIHFSPGGLTFVLAESAAQAGSQAGSPAEIRETVPARRWVVKLDFIDPNKNVEPVGLEETGALISFFKGKTEEWKTGLAAHSKIVYQDLWPGIDLVYYGTVDRMKYEFIVHPGADPSRIKLAYRGAENVSLTEEGRLEVSTPIGGFKDDIPVAWQEIGGEKTCVEMAYELADLEGPAHVYGFDVGEYDHTRPLVLDPAVLVYCGYIGGSGGQTWGSGIAVDAAGNAYVTGTSGSTTSFPVTVGPDLTHNGETDAFIAKVNSAGTALVYCGYIGGSGYDRATGIAVDSLGNAYVTGFTESTETSFPVTVGPDLTHNGEEDAFIAKVNSAGTALVYCGYIGGAHTDAAYGIAVDGSGNAYVTGRADSTETSFPVTVGPDLFHKGSSEDAFVAKVRADGTALAYCGYIGGYKEDIGRGIAVDAAGNAYVTGTSGSTTSFPVTVGPDLTHNGETDAFIAKVNSAGTALDYCGYIGGAHTDAAYGIAVDGSGNAYVTGYTWSTEATFPVTVGPDLTHNGETDAFIAKVNSAGTALDYCGYIGGAHTDAAYGIAMDGSGNAYVTGNTESTEADFPVTVGPDLTFNGAFDAFVAKVNASGTALEYCGYIGGRGGDLGAGIAVDGSGNAYVTGYTWSHEADFPVTVGPDLTFNGGLDAIVARITTSFVADPVITSLLPSSAAAGDPDLNLSVVGTDFIDGAVVRWDGNDRPTTFINVYEVNAKVGVADLATGKVVQVTVRNPSGGLSNALEFTINNPVPSLTSMSPTKVTVGGSGFTLTLLGSNFVPNSVVRWGGNSRTTTYVSRTELQAAIASGDITTAGEFQVTVANPAPAGGTSNAVAFRVVSFTLGSQPTSATVTAGQSATYTVQVTPQYGSFDSAVSFSCTGLPSGCTASFSPASVTPGANPASTTLTLTTRARTEASAGGMFAASGHVPPALGLLLIIPLFGLIFPFGRILPARLSRRWLAAGALICLIILIGGCSAGGGGGGTPSTGTPAGTYQVTVQGASGGLTVSTQVTLVVR